MTVQNFAKGQLKAFVERIERLEEEKAAIAEDIKEVYAEVKGVGFDVKAMRAVIRLRRQDAEERAEHEALVDLYKDALGMLADTPLGAAALASAASGQRGNKRDSVLENLTPHKGKTKKKRRGEPRPDSPEAAAARKFQRAMGTPVELTEKEKAQGYGAAYEHPERGRVAIKVGMTEDEILAAADRAEKGPKESPAASKAVRAAADRAEETAGAR